MKEAIIFDMDGTLLNTLEDLYLSTNAALAKYGFPERTLEEIRQFVGNGADNLMRRAVPQEKTILILRIAFWRSENIMACI